MGIGAAGVSDIRILLPGKRVAEFEGGDKGKEGLVGPDAEVRSLFPRLKAIPPFRP